MHIASFQVSLLFTELPSFSWTLTFSYFWHFWKPELFFLLSLLQCIERVWPAPLVWVGRRVGSLFGGNTWSLFVTLHSGLSSPLCCQWWPPAGPVMLPPSLTTCIIITGPNMVTWIPSIKMQSCCCWVLEHSECYGSSIFNLFWIPWVSWRSLQGTEDDLLASFSFATTFKVLLQDDILSGLSLLHSQ